MNERSGDQRETADDAQDSDSRDQVEVTDQLETDQEGDGPGWMPAIMAATLLLLIAVFVCCGVSTWLLFQKRTELAIRTLRGSFIPALEQSLLAPQEKIAVLARIDEFTSDLERGKYEDWQAAGVMQRLQRLPVLQWGQLAAIEAFVDKSDDPEKDRSLEQLSRLRKAVELGKATSVEFDRVLRPAIVTDRQAPTGQRLIQPLTADLVQQVIAGAKDAADRAEVPQQRFTVTIDSLVAREIEAGVRDGGF